MTPRVLSILTNDRHEVFQRSVIEGADEIAQARGFELRVIEVRPPTTTEMLSLALHDVTGVLVVANVVPDTVLNAMLAADIPVALISHQVTGLPIPAVAPHNAQGIALLMEHIVVECGCSQPVFIRGDLGQSDGIQRETAFRQEVMRYDLELSEDSFLKGDFNPATAASSLRHFLSNGNSFDAIVAADYLMAIAALDVLHTSGLSVPNDVAVVGFGDGPEAATSGLTTVAADVVELGRRGARQLIGQLEGLTIRGLTLLSTKMVKRKTSC